MHENFDKKNDKKISSSEAEINLDPDDAEKLFHLYGKEINITNRQEAIEELAGNVEKYKNIIETINGVVYLVDENGFILFISKSIQNVFGYRQVEVLGKNFFEFVPEEDLTIAKSRFAKLTTAKNSLSEYRLKSKDGKLKRVNFISKAVFNKSEFAGVMGILIDISKDNKATKILESQSHLLKTVGEGCIAINLISEGITFGISNSKRTENILREVGKKLPDILEYSKILFYTHTPDNVINYVSPHSKKLLGLDPDELKMRWTELLTDNPVNQKGIELTKIAIETGVPQQPFEIEMRNDKKEIVWFEVQEIPVVKDGKTEIIVGSLRDITERKKAEEKLQTNQSLLTHALELANMGHWEYDIATDTFTFNDQFYKMLHTNIKEMGSYTMSSTEYVKRFVHPEDISFVSKRIGVIKSSEERNISKELEHRIIYADGNVGNIIVRIGIVKDRKGKTIRTYGVNQDITKRKAVENELIEAKERAEESNRLKSSFLANMSHEIRTPMFGILGFADILKDELIEPSHIEMVSTIKESGMRLISTLNSILDLSRIEANKQDIKTSPVNLNEIIKGVIQLYKPLVKNKNIYLKYIFPEKKIYLNSDKDLLYKIFNNLIDNAVKYTDHGGIVVKLMAQDENSDKKILVEITDTGIGISKEFHKIIFEPFRQASEGSSRKYEGAGLGLSITKKFIELLNGSIFLKSKPEEGSTFIVTFPYPGVAKETTYHSKTPPVVNAITNNPFNNVKVLLVEDEPSNASVISTYLKDYLKLDHVSDGNSAVKACSSKKYDVVLMDINLKGIDGVETLKQICNLDNHYSKIPIIAVTAYAMVGDREKFISNGFTDYISKPFNRSQLLMLLTDIFKND